MARRSVDNAGEHDALAVNAADGPAPESAQLGDVAAKLVQNVRPLMTGQHGPGLLQRLPLDVLHGDTVSVAADDGRHRDRRVSLDVPHRHGLARMLVWAHAVTVGDVLCDAVAVVDDVARAAVVDDLAFGVR